MKCIHGFKEDCSGAELVNCFCKFLNDQQSSQQKQIFKYEHVGYIKGIKFKITNMLLNKNNNVGGRY